MSTERAAHQLVESHCPLNGGEVCMDLCQPCRYFRGAAHGSGAKRWTVICNWPRDGSYVSPAPEVRRVRAPVPDAFTRAFREEAER